MVVYLGQNQGSQLAFGKGFIFVERFTEGASQSELRDSADHRIALANGRTHIWPIDPATSVQRVSISSFKVCRAKTLSSGSVSDRKPRTPEAEVRPGMVDLEWRRSEGVGDVTSFKDGR